MPGISVHGVDVARGVPAQGMRVEVFALDSNSPPTRRRLAEGALAANGMLDHAIVSERLAPGAYEVVFHAGEFFVAAGLASSGAAFLADVPFRFTISDPEQHYHLPMKITPWGFALFRGS